MAVYCMRRDIMPLLQVRDCPEDIYKKISIYAKKQNRTIAQQVISILEKGLQLEQPNIERRKALLEKINLRSAKPEVEKIDDVALLREDRNR
jgi:plasmid stability protein